MVSLQMDDTVSDLWAPGFGPCLHALWRSMLWELNFLKQTHMECEVMKDAEGRQWRTNNCKKRPFHGESE